VRRGYEETTTREIAARAAVGMGTVFTYADNKRDLLFLIANEDLSLLVALAERSVSDRAPFLRNLLAVFRSHYEFFGREPELSRLMLREMVFYDTGRQAEVFRATRQRLIRLIERIVATALERGAIRSREDHRTVAWVAFGIYQVEIRRWLASGDLDVENGMRALRRALKLLIDGLAPARRAHGGRRVQRKNGQRSSEEP
jgi:AcrR family transcriptional regulator